ncbi:hypothetical protein PL10110_260022 [Planktothrix agardhii]|nr:hypothetical protein PL10110_260022 [Planktothrix agardhii]
MGGVEIDGNITTDLGLLYKSFYSFSVTFSASPISTPNYI